MCTNKHFDRICVAVIVAALILTILFMNGEALGITKVIDEDSENHENSQYFTSRDLDGNWDSSSATVITLDGSDGKISGNGAYMQDGNLVIVSAGDYSIEGTLTDGSIIIDSEKNAKIGILLHGISLSCSDDACIRVNQADKVFLTLAEGTENQLISGSTYSETALADKTDGVIFAHDDLTINGAGSLSISGGISHGIAANDNLLITGGSIQVTAPEDGLHANDHLNICNASITIDCQDDGIHADDSVYIESGTIEITNSYEGIEAKTIEIAGGEIAITCTDDGINASDGSETDNGFGFKNRKNGEDFSKGRPDRSFDSMAPPDMQDTNGAMTPPDMSEQTENTETTGDSETAPLVLITGGKITITNIQGNDADGIDSNGDIRINGGEVYILLNGASGSNCALDYGSETGGVCQINGGIVVAAGGSSMIEAIDSSSSQASMTVFTSETAAEHTLIQVTDGNGTVLLSREIPTSFTAVTISCPELKTGESYTVSIGEQTEIISLEQIAGFYGNRALENQVFDNHGFRESFNKI